MKPSDFANYPHQSVLKNPKAETIAQNIMRKLIETGNEFRLLSWDEFNGDDRTLFDQVVVFCANEHTTKSFIPSWGEAWQIRLEDVIVFTATTFQDAVRLIDEMSYMKLDFRIYKYGVEVKQF